MVDYFSATFLTLHFVFTGWLLSACGGIPLGILITRKKFRRFFQPLILRTTGFIETVPVLAMIVVLIVVIGLNRWLVYLGLFLYGLFPLVMNTYKGIESVDAALIEVAKGMGMDEREILLRVELPLALPLIFTGLEIAMVYIIGIAPVLTFFSAQGQTLGWLLFKGISKLRMEWIYIAGAILVAMGIGLSRAIRISKHFIKWQR